jgi:hypothetical protein
MGLAPDRVGYGAGPRERAWQGDRTSGRILSGPLRVCRLLENSTPAKSANRVDRVAPNLGPGPAMGAAKCVKPRRLPTSCGQAIQVDRALGVRHYRSGHDAHGAAGKRHFPSAGFASAARCRDVEACPCDGARCELHLDSRRRISHLGAERGVQRGPRSNTRSQI